MRTMAAIIRSKIQNIKTENVFLFYNVIYSCDAKQNFQQHYSSLCHMILQKSF